jgi:flagellar basal-body rod protein FlgG
LDDKGQRPYHDVPIGKVSQGVFVDEIYTDFSGGGLKQTGAPLDLGISGDGFFCVMTTDAQGQALEMYTRDGSFTLGGDGALMTMEGNYVSGGGGIIRIPPGHITISEEGRVYSNGEYVDTLKMVDFDDKHRLLRKTKDNLYAATDENGRVPFTGRVNEGFLENSNVSSVREMVEMIAVARAYETNQRIITIHDTTMNHIVNDIARK